MLTTEKNKKFSGEINTQSTSKFKTFQDETKINPSSPVYIFCKLKSEINTQNENGWTPIYRSIAANNLEALYELLKLGADPNIPNNLGETPLYLSVDTDNYDALIILLQYKADCNLAKKNGNTPLHIATKRNKTQFMSALLRNNSNPNIINKLYSQTATHLAIINKVDESTLVEFNICKADIYNIKDKYDKTPFDYAKDVGDQNYINLLIRIFGNNNSTINLLRENRSTWGGYGPNEMIDNDETTPPKVNFADVNNSHFVSLSKNVFISFDENDLNNKDSGSVIIKNTNDENKNMIYNTSSMKSDSLNNDRYTNYENNKENLDLNTSIKKTRNLKNENDKSNLNSIMTNTAPKGSNLLDINFNTSNQSDNSIKNSEIGKKKKEVKNIISDTIQKINMSNNSEITSNFNLSENNNIASNNISQINSNNNIFNMEKRTSSKLSNNSKTLKINNKSNPISHSQSKKDISEMNPLDMINQVITTSNNSNIFSELQINTNNNKNNTNSDDDNNNKTPHENSSNMNNIPLNDSLEYSKSNTHILSEHSNQKANNYKNSTNKMNEVMDFDNLNGLNITINEYEDINKNKENKSNNQHRQISYHNNKQSFSNNNKEYNASKRNSNTSTNNYTLNNSKKATARNTLNPNDLSTTPNSIQNSIISKQKFYKINQTQPEYQKEKLSKDNYIEDYQSNLENMNTNNYNYIPYPSLKNNRLSSYNASINSNSYFNNKPNKFPSLKLSEIENINNSNNYYNSFISKNDNKLDELNLCSPQNIPNELLTRLRDWLISCDLLCYYNLLIKNDIYDIDLYIHNLKNNKINISYKDIEDIGIKKPGHIFRFLLKLQIDSGVLDQHECNLIINKFNSNVLTTIGLTSSTNIIKCCGMVLFKQNGTGPESNDSTNICCNASTSSFNGGCNYNDIFGFLKYKGLLDYKENFIHNGFDQIDYIFIQLFSNFKFNKEILNDYMHIYSEKDKKKVIQKLYEEKRKIALELGLNYDVNEEEEILNSQFESNSNINESENNCLIF